MGTLLLVGAACGTSNDEVGCVRGQEAEICAVEDEGSVSIRAERLRPGSLLTVGTGNGQDQTATITPEGRPEPAISFVGGKDAGPLVLNVAGIAANGSALAGQIRLRG